MSRNIRFFLGTVLSFTLALVQHAEASSDCQPMPGLEKESARRPALHVDVAHSVSPEDYPETPAAFTPNTAMDYGIKDAADFFSDSADEPVTSGTCTASSETSSVGGYYGSFSTATSASTQTFSSESSEPTPELLRIAYCEAHLVRDARPPLPSLAQAFSQNGSDIMPTGTASSTASLAFSEEMDGQD